MTALIVLVFIGIPLSVIAIVSTQVLSKDSSPFIVIALMAVPVVFISASIGLLLLSVL